MVQAIKKTDGQIHQDVIAELKWDTRVKETDIGVEVDAGVVTLTGTVDSWAARMAAREAAHRVAGVLDVADDVKVKLPGSYERNDTEIAQAVRQALEWDVLLPDKQIRTTVTNGVVTLEGTVEHWSQHDDAARCIRNLAGVREVHNLLEVRPSGPRVSPQAVRDAIQQALERHAEHASKHVMIAVDGGKVTLSGTVPSWTDRQAIEGAARGTPGVGKVDDRLTISP